MSSRINRQPETGRKSARTIPHPLKQSSSGTGGGSVGRTRLPGVIDAHNASLRPSARRLGLRRCRARQAATTTETNAWRRYAGLAGYGLFTDASAPHTCMARLAERLAVDLPARLIVCTYRDLSRTRWRHVRTKSSKGAGVQRQLCRRMIRRAMRHDPGGHAQRDAGQAGLPPRRTPTPALRRKGLLHPSAAPDRRGIQPLEQ